MQREPAASFKRRGLLLAAGSLVALAGIGVLALRLRHTPAAEGVRQWVRGIVSPIPKEDTPLYRADRPLTIYDDALAPGWQDWSWATRDLASSQRSRSGRRSISMTPSEFKGVYLHHAPMPSAGYGSLQLFVWGEPVLQVKLALTDSKFGPAVPLAARLKSEEGLPEGWRVARIPLAELGMPATGGTFNGVVFQAAGAERRPDVFLDDISLVPDTALPVAPVEITVPVTVDLAADRHPISPYIYGMSFAPPAYLYDLRLALNRWGGNDKSRYNWVHGNACNAARDWRWANRVAVDKQLSPLPSSAADDFIRANKMAGAESLMTVPTLGWVAKDTDNNNVSTGVPEHGGTPLTMVGGAIAGYDPAANRAKTSIRSAARKGKPFTTNPGMADGVVYQDEWIHHLTRKFGEGGVRFYAMDNEPDIWDVTHTDVHPGRPGYDDTLANFLEYATAVKAVDPKAAITGPVISGWTGYEYSALDRGEDNFRTRADRKRHGDEPFLLWFLKKVREHDQKSGKRTLDVLDVHYYPQGEGVYGTKADAATQALRLRQTRGLWDPAYMDESWIRQPVKLISRLKGWIAAGYPGTRIGISEWSFGGETDISGALATAETLGIFGREDVYSANYWTYPPKGSPAYLAFKLVRNPAGDGKGIGDTSCRAVTPPGSQVSCFAATDGKSGELTLLLVNKLPRTAALVPVTVSGGKAGGAARTWTLSAKQSTTLVPGEVVAGAGGEIRLSLPAYSAMLVRFGEDARK